MMTAEKLLELIIKFFEKDLFTWGTLKNILSLLFFFLILLSILSIKFTTLYETKPSEIWLYPNVTHTLEEGRFQINYNNVEGRCVDLTIFDVKRNIDYTVPICDDLKLPLEDWGFIKIKEVYLKYDKVLFDIYRTYRMNVLILLPIFIIFVIGSGAIIIKIKNRDKSNGK